MKNMIILNGQEIAYELEYKKVKNINLRIKCDGSIYVSANKRVGIKVIEEFIVSKADFILKAIEKFSKKQELTEYFTEDELCEEIFRLCKKHYPYFQAFGVGYPIIKFRKMVSRWGSCHPAKGILTFNLNLIYAPKECIEYVVLHEFTHFLQANHSARFYDELEKVCPGWKMSRKKLKEINIGKR